MPTATTAFYAYPSSPQDLAETVEMAIEELNQGGTLSIFGWKQLAVSGKVVIDTILKAIDQHSMFMADVTGLNNNVLFELGYALARAKPIWLSLNTSFERASREYAGLEATLPPIGYSPYTNRHSLASAVYRNAVGNTSQPTIQVPPTSEDSATSAKPILLYLKSAVSTDASIEVTQRLGSVNAFSVHVDDPKEVFSQPLDWYLGAVSRASAVVVHLLSDDHAHSRMHNAKCALVAGIAHGQGRPLLLLAHSPYACPVDYLNLLKSHQTAAQARTAASNWLSEIQSGILEHWNRIQEHQYAKQKSADLRGLWIGDVVAEHEEKRLVEEYFVETTQFLEALNGRQTLFVGRKGTGKTANLFALAAQISEDKRNHVCVIKPVDYELTAIVRMLKQTLHRAEEGFLVESLWKFLIFTELTSSIANELTGRPGHILLSESEKELLEVVREHQDVIGQPFSIRLQVAAESLCGIDTSAPPANQRAKVSEILHRTMLARLRRVLGDVLESRHRVVVLIDNLDKAWGVGQDTPVLTKLILGLLGVTRRIIVEFKESSPTSKSVDLGMVVFLRSDIFAYVESQAPERDKLNYTRLLWDDEEALIRVIDERLSNHFDRSMTPDEIWEAFFDPIIGELPVKKFAVRAVLPKPRDLIYIVKAAVGTAVNRGHTKVQEDDWITARTKYSEFVFGSLLAEDDPRIGCMESVLFEFAGSQPELTRGDVERRIASTGLSASQVERYRELLCDLNFLGIRTRNGDVVYPQDDNRRRMLERTNRASMESTQAEPSYVLNPVFYDALQVKS